MNNSQKDFVSNVSNIEEWCNIINDLQSLIHEDDFISLYVKNDNIIIDKNSISLNGIICKCSYFTFSDFEKIYLAFCDYLK